MRRTNLSIRWFTKTGQTTPKNSIKKLQPFLLFSKKYCEHGRNDMPSVTTVERSGSKTVPIKMTVHVKQRTTVCLAVKGYGLKMKPFIMIPGERMKIEVVAVKNAIVKCHLNGWMNDDLTNDWVTEVLHLLHLNKYFFVWDSL